ncbi:hypothetical protein RJ639_014561 [Escallonia herrerae]|uniref:Uncharacterized protein n=1 Tax=Escallonia herrerae TaxID=1293975 RepID=A0AA88VEV2_9ASTE|nr:hypothetical protein RJ639_014561 [Escallonia herrerae]
MVYPTLLEWCVVSDGSCSSKQFGVAYDALSFSNLEKLESGMGHACYQCTTKKSTSITKGLIRSISRFWWVKLEDSTDVKLFSCPQASTKFAYFLIDALQEKGENMKPLV